jgi:hypothetical protein
MKILSRVADIDAQRIHRQFPALREIQEKDSDGGMQKVAISVFDHWLRDEAEWHLLDCFEGPERVSRDKRLEAHWLAIFDLTPVYTVRFRGRRPHKARLVLKRYSSREGFLEQSRWRPKHSPSQFLVLPELGCIYAAGWDDTNVLYFASRETARPVLDLALSATLHVLDYGS